MALKEKLERLRRRQPSGYSADIVPDWQDAIRGLFEDVERWLTPYISQGLMRPQRTAITLEEEDLGTYPVERLDIDLGGGRELALLPVARLVAGGTGRVDMYAKGRMAEGYMLLRRSGTTPPAPRAGGSAPDPQAEVAKGGWMIWPRRPESTFGIAPGSAPWHGPGTLLDAASLEAAIEGLLD